jgi:glutathione S-transferase
MFTLYQFQFSHYCEKARWALDYKGIPYAQRNLLPGLHTKVARKLAPKSCLPIIVDGGTVVQDSTSIISFLGQRFPDRPLTPRDPTEAKEALEWEEYFDEEIGIPLRLWFYYHTLPDRDRALRFMLDGAPWYGRPVFALIFPKVRTAMMEVMNIHADSAKRSEERLLMALERLDGALKERRFLVGDRFSRADLTACALLLPYCAPGKSDAEVSAAFPEHVSALRNKHKTRHFFGWLLDSYRNYRQPVLGKTA